ncbi:MAG: hypothetical protein KDD92_07930 [Caldilineaceae bacterium]|nr:hypothetical protein [Caldilineaceae bacterium]
MTIQPPDREPNPAESWLRRTWERLRSGRWRDVIIADVDAGASNVAVGKNIFQLNVGGRNITPYVAGILLALLLLVGYFGYPLAEPLWNPAQMQGQFNIAVAQFGALDGDTVRVTDESRALSAWFYEQLAAVYAETPDVPLIDSTVIWHDSRTDTAQNVALRAIRGATPQARAEHARKLAERIGAHMVIYGYVVENSPTGLDLEFYLSPRMNDETATIVGPYALGSPITLPAAFDVGDPIVNATVGERLRTRTEALFWLTAGLTHEVLGRTEEALVLLRRGEEALGDWQADEGREILYFFIGREELFLGNDDAAETAFQTAVTVRPDYARAHNGLGSVHFFRAQEISPQERLDSPSELDAAATAYATAQELARAQGDELVEELATLGLGMTARLQGESAYVQHAFDDALASFAQAEAQLTQARDYFAGASHYRLTAQAYESLGLTYFQRADIMREQGDLLARRADLDAARTAFEACAEQALNGGFDELLRERIIAASCLPLRQAVEAALAES